MNTQTRSLYRSRKNRMIAGVCAGLGDYLGIDPTIVRLVFAIGLIFGHAFVAILYLVMFIVVPEEALAVQPMSPSVLETPPANEPGVAQ